MNNVPVLKIASVIKDLGDNLFHKKIEKIPSTATILNIIEGKHAATLVRAILKSTHVNLAWDATSFKGFHVNEVHVWTALRVCVLDVRLRLMVQLQKII